MSEEAELRAELVRQYRRTSGLGLNELASGNLSCKFGDGMLISPTGATAESITDETVVYVAPDGSWSSEQSPSSEWQMHAAIYRVYPRTGAVVHTHSDNCVACACRNAPLPGFHYLVGVFGGDDVPCVPYSTFGSLKLAEDTAAALGDRTACLLANHGMICRAKTLDLGVNLAHRLEILCRQYILARQAGEPRLLTQEEWIDFHDRIKTSNYGSKG